MHDLKYMGNNIPFDMGVIDTLFLSPLLFPARPYHKLLKDHKLLPEDENDPLADSFNTRDLFHDEVNAFGKKDEQLKGIFYSLLGDKREFENFFRYVGYEKGADSLDLIPKRFRGLICENRDILPMVKNHPVELAYCLSLTDSGDRYAITPPWVLMTFPKVNDVMIYLRNNPCEEGCAYCDSFFDIHGGLKRYFGFESFKTFSGKPLQEEAVRSAIGGKSLLAIFPTGGGKSLAFQLPALMGAITAKGVTVVISPLVSLMKDQIDNLEGGGITEAVTINGLLDPVERALSFERIERGQASILYISPESLRLKSIEYLLMKRNVIRFVIDEAHCFSSWGQDFRVDYLYIGDFIKNLSGKKGLEHPINVSCFTATARVKVIEDICRYFKDKLNLDMEVISTSGARSNLKYIVKRLERDEEKFNTLVNLIGSSACPVIVYVNRTKDAEELAEKLTRRGFAAKPYHGKMDRIEKNRNQNGFIRGEERIMVATSAFGMGVDKKDVGMVIHYEISGSLESYVQEAGRAGRDENINAECYILYNDNDLDVHFRMVRLGKLGLKEINQIWSAIKKLTAKREVMSASALEIARLAGWDESIYDLETKVKTAVAALEESFYLKREQNAPRLYATGILVKNVIEANEKIEGSSLIDGEDKENAKRIMSSLISKRRRKKAGNDSEGESRVDYISDRLGIEKERVVRIIYGLIEEGILADTMDMAAHVEGPDFKRRALGILASHRKIENHLLDLLEEGIRDFNIKEVNSLALSEGIGDSDIRKIITVLNFWAVKSHIKKEGDKNRQRVNLLIPTAEIRKRMIKIHDVARFTLDLLEGEMYPGDEKSHKGFFIEFSVVNIKKKYEEVISFEKREVSTEEVEDCLFYLGRTGALSLEGGFLVLYNALTIKRMEKDNRIRYKRTDYRKLEEHYDNRIQQIHIVGEYAKKMIDDYNEALLFVNDYFVLNYPSFLNKYFPGVRQAEIRKSITKEKFKEIFGNLSPAQLKVINDGNSPYIGVAAGPGSGKTRILVHKMASLMLIEDVRSNQLLMLTFSRAAATEFKRRLLDLVGSAAHYVDIKTFHSFCFDFMGIKGDIENCTDIVPRAVEHIKRGEGEPDRITKTVLVIDEAQDMDENEYNLVRELMEYNENMRVIAVGDDDQGIFRFRGANLKFFANLFKSPNTKKYELLTNFRSRKNLVELANLMVKRIKNRLKRTRISPYKKDPGEIVVVKYGASNFYEPLVDHIMATELMGNTCVITENNQQAAILLGLLERERVKVRLININEGFELYNLLEVRYFLKMIMPRERSTDLIDKKDWEDGKGRLTREFINSPNYEVCLNMISDFENTNKDIKYFHDFVSFVKESKYEDFYRYESEIVYISTIHKAKGREFDNVFMMLDNTRINEDDDIRRIYVGLTRAKNNLYIHCNGDFFDNMDVPGLKFMKYEGEFSAPRVLVYQTEYRDVWLDYFIKKSKYIQDLRAEDDLRVTGEGLVDKRGICVLKFSRLMGEKLKQWDEEKNFIPVKASVNFIVYWKKDDDEYKIFLPRIYLVQKTLSVTEHQGPF